MTGRIWVLYRKELRQILHSRGTVTAACAVPALMLLFVTFANIITVKYQFGRKPIYLLTSDHPVSGTFLFRHFSLPVLVTISAMVTPSIVMGDVLLGERERRTLDLLVALPVAVGEVVLAKLAAVLTFALVIALPIFALNVLLVNGSGYGSAQQAGALLQLMLAAIAYSSASSLLIAVVAGEPRAANIVSGLLLGPVVPIEGLILAADSGLGAVTISSALLVVLAVLCLLPAFSMLSFERLGGQ